MSMLVFLRAGLARWTGLGLSEIGTPLCRDDRDAAFDGADEGHEADRS
jgi:hypothetical protein